MKTMDKVVMGVPALAGGIIVIATKLGAVIALLASLFSFWLGFREDEPIIDNGKLIAIGAGFGALAAFLFKQWNAYKNRKIKFMKALTDNLYFKNLDNNAGVFHHLIDAAEEEECKESLLAYVFLHASEKPLREEELDQQIEAWFEEKWDTKTRLRGRRRAAETRTPRPTRAHCEDGLWSVIPMNEAKERLDHTWDNYFEFNQGSLSTV
jgi:hypothetical protein